MINLIASRNVITVSGILRSSVKHFFSCFAQIDGKKLRLNSKPVFQKCPMCLALMYEAFIGKYASFPFREVSFTTSTHHTTETVKHNICTI